MKKKIAILTATRAEYGYLRWLIEDINNNEQFELQLIVTGSHLSIEQGYTIDQIKKDGLPIAATYDAKIDNSNSIAVAETMGRYAAGFPNILTKLQPDVLVVLGDRYELLPICSAAYIMGIPIAHISGGDVTEGALDDGIRNAITMLAEYHFPGTEDSAHNIVRMRSSSKNVFVVGELSLDWFNRVDLLSREQLAQDLNLDIQKKWILMTWHPETKEALEYNMLAVKNIVAALQEIPNVEIIMTKANTDLGGLEINNYLETIAAKDSKFKLFSSLGQIRYLSFMKQAHLVIGNSSSGIVETPFLGVPCINIGNRQKGRHCCENVVSVDSNILSLRNALSSVSEVKYKKNFYYGNGRTTNHLVDCLLSLKTF